MALGQPKNSQELISALRDEDGNIRWLAVYMASQPGATAQAEARKVLGLIADTAEEDSIRQQARKYLQDSLNN